MAYYGSDYDRWPEDRRPRSQYGWDDEFGPVDDARRGGRPASGWGRPEFNVSAGAYGAHDVTLDRARGEWRAEGRAGAGQGWRTGEPWGRGVSAATERTVREIMTENPESVTSETPLAQVARRMRDLDVGIIPVVRDEGSGTLQGVITDRDIAVRAVAEGADMKKAKAGDYMSTDVATVREGDTVRDVFSVMKRKQVRRVPVTDDSGRLVGIVAQADLAVDYAGLDLDREAEVAEVLERVSEPARPRRLGRRVAAGMRPDEDWGHGHTRYDHEFAHAIRGRWQDLKREARQLFDRGYDRPYF